MTDRAFVDTNVLVYAADAGSTGKRERARTLLGDIVATGRVVISTQVLQEFYVAVTRKLARPLTHADAERAVHTLAELTVVGVDAATVVAAIARTGAHGISLWDSLIIQSAIDSGCGLLLTEDLQHGAVFENVRIVNPFGDEAEDGAALRP